MNIYSNDCRSRSWDRSYCISEKVDVRIGSWLCRNALPEVSMRRDFGRVALLEHFFGLDYALIAAMSG
jgi:hypothetical protein